MQLLPLADSIRWSAVPYAAHQQVIGVAFVKPTPAAVAEIASRTGMRVFPGVAPEVRILQAQQRCYGLSIEEPVRRLLEVSDGSVTARLALEELLLLTSAAPKPAPVMEGPTDSVMPPLPPPTMVQRETADEAGSRTKALRQQVAEALAEFDSRSREIFAGRQPRETPPGTVVDVVREAESPSAPEAEAPKAKPRRKTGLTTEDLRELLMAPSTPTVKRPAARRKTGFTTDDLRELIR